MFDALSTRLAEIFRNLRGQGRLTEANIRDGLREIRLALLEADVHFQVARDLLDRVQEAALGQEVLRSLTPAQHIVKIVRDEMAKLLGGEHSTLRFAPQPPTVILLAGLQGSGKTTTTAKLGRFLAGRGRTPLLVAADLARPAAVEQLRRLGSAAGCAVHASSAGPGEAVRAASEGLEEARRRGYDVVLIDTAGRLHVDDELMSELVRLRDAVIPTETLYVADAMTGQDAVISARRFHEVVGLTGVILTKLDGDARGGAAMSLRAVTGVPIRFVGVGERAEELEPFHPERMASRILGMGDVLTLVEKAQALADDEEARQLAGRMKRGTGFTLDDLRDQIRRMEKLGPLDQFLRLLPGADRLPLGGLDGGELVRARAILDSMTPGERRDHTVINGSRRKRIARGSGTTLQDVNRLLKQFGAMEKMLRKAGGRLDPRSLRGVIR